MLTASLPKPQTSFSCHALVMTSACVLTLFLSCVPVLQAQTFSVFYNFAGGADGELPNGDLVQDAAGNLYGTTQLGGTGGSGTIFMLSPAATETVLYSFSGLTDGQQPSAGLYRDSAGNLYGTTQFGGDPTCKCGTVFKLDTTRFQIHSRGACQPRAVDAAWQPDAARANAASHGPRDVERWPVHRGGHGEADRLRDQASRKGGRQS